MGFFQKREIKLENILKVILNNFGLKLIALILAILTWLYIFGQLNKAK